MADNEYQKELQAEIEELKADKKAMQDELKSGRSDESNAGAIRESLLPNVPSYIANIDALAHAAESEGVQLSANKLLVEWAVGGKLVATDGSADGDFKKLLTKLQNKVEKRPPGSNYVDSPKLDNTKPKAKE